VVVHAFGGIALVAGSSAAARASWALLKLLRWEKGAALIAGLSLRCLFAGRFRSQRRLVLLMSHTRIPKYRIEQGIGRVSVDSDRPFIFLLGCSGVPIALIGTKRESGAISGLSNRKSNLELPPQLSAVSPSPRCHWALLLAKLGKAEMGRDPRARRPA